MSLSVTHYSMWWHKNTNNAYNQLFLSELSVDCDVESGFGSVLNLIGSPLTHAASLHQFELKIGPVVFPVY